MSARRTQFTPYTVIEDLGHRKKGAFGTSGVMEDYKVGSLLFLRESQGQKPVTTKKAQNRKAYLSLARLTLGPFKHAVPVSFFHQAHT